MPSFSLRHMPDIKYNRIQLNRNYRCVRFCTIIWRQQKYMQWCGVFSNPQQFSVPSLFDSVLWLCLYVNKDHAKIIPNLAHFIHKTLIMWLRHKCLKGYHFWQNIASPKHYYIYIYIYRTKQYIVPLMLTAWTVHT